MKYLVVQFLVATNRDFEFVRFTEFDQPFLGALLRNFAESEWQEDLAIAAFVAGIQDGALLEAGVPDGRLAKMIIQDDAFIEHTLGDANRRPEADGLGPEAGMIGTAVIGQGVVDLALVDQEGIFLFAAGFGDRGTLASVEEHAHTHTASWAAACFPLLAGVRIDRQPAAEWFRETTVRIFSGFGVAQQQRLEFRVLGQVVARLEDRFACPLSFIDYEQHPR